MRISAGTPVVGSSTLLQKVMEEMDDSAEPVLPENSSPVVRRVATRKSGELKRARMSVESAGSAGTRRTSPRLSRSSVAESEDVVEEVAKEVEEEIGDSTIQIVDGQDVDVEIEVEEDQDAGVVDEAEEAAEPEPDEAEEVGEEEAAQRLGRKRPRRSMPALSPELSSGLVEESPAVKRRRGREPASPAQQQQPAKKTRTNKPQPKPRPEPQPEPQLSPQPPSRASPQPRTQIQNQQKAKPKPKPKRKRQPKKKSKGASDEDGEENSGTVSVTVQRFTKPRSGDKADGEDQGDEIPFSNRGGVNAVDVLSKLCEELTEAYMNKLEERISTAEDAATKREQRTMYRALEAFQEELRTRLLEHVSAEVPQGICISWLTVADDCAGFAGFSA